ncbi:MAG: DUF2304 domain-containing protein [Actinobacteria bacterium]|nr:MAG: DUF2304 domain-containing protein [Actinomycetota bacterium]
MTGSVLAIVAALVVTIFIVELLRRGILREKFAALWLLVSVVVLILAIFPQILVALARWLGVAVPANLLFFLAALLLLAVSVQLSFEVSRLEARTRRLAEDLALLAHRVSALDQRGPRQQSGDQPGPLTSPAEDAPPEHS